MKMSSLTRYNTWARKALALISVPALALPSAIGVQRYLAPESGAIAAWSAAIGFEVLYVGINILILRSPELRRYARNVALAAVATAVLLNSLAHYQVRVAGAFDGAPLNVLASALAVIASLPLAGLAYAVSVLLHRLSEDEAAATAVLEEALSQPTVTIGAVERPALSDGMSKTARVKALAAELGISESTAWRKVKAGELSIEEP